MAKKNNYTHFRPQIRSMHPTHNILRSELPRFKFRSVVRLGSVTELPDTIARGGRRLEINTVSAVKNSANKRLMKEKFTEAGVRTAQWWKYINNNDGTPFVEVLKGGDENHLGADKLPYPIVAKHIFGSRGTGNTLIKDQRQLENWMVNKNMSNYIFEKFYSFVREYRLHITEDGCFYTCRKMLKKDTPENEKWHRHDSNCSWILEDNALFDKPANWNDIVADCVKALRAVGLDIGGFDVKVQSSKKENGRERKDPDYIIIESNSACSFGDMTAKKYIAELPKVLNSKYNKVNA